MNAFSNTSDLSLKRLTMVPCICLDSLARAMSNQLEVFHVKVADMRVMKVIAKRQPCRSGLQPQLYGVGATRTLRNHHIST